SPFRALLLPLAERVLAMPLRQPRQSLQPDLHFQFAAVLHLFGVAKLSLFCKSWRTEKPSLLARSPWMGRDGPPGREAQPERPFLEERVFGVAAEPGRRYTSTF